MDGCNKTLLSLVDPGSATISIVLALPLQEVGHLTFTSRQRAMRPYCHGSVGSGGSPWNCTDRQILTARQRAGRPVSMYIYFIQFTFYMFYDAFWWYVRTYGIHFLFDIYIFHWNIFLSIMCIFLYYHTQDCIDNLTSFLDHHIIVFSRVLLYSIWSFFVDSTHYIFSMH